MPTSGDFVARLWSEQRVWSRAADRAKAEVGRYRVLGLFLVVLASVLGTSATLVGGLSDPLGRGLAFIAGLSLGLIPLARRPLDVPTYERWSRMRSVSEALKTEIYTYLAGVAPYREADRTTRLLDRSTDVVRRGDDLLGWLRPSDRRPRELPPVTDVETYLAERVGRQVTEYYLPRGRGMAVRARNVRWIQAGLSVLAVTLGVVAAADTTAAAPWIGVIGTVSGAVIAHSAAGRYGFLQLEYFRTAAQLSRIVDRYRHASESRAAVDDWVVAECEQIISFQNEAWMIELVAPPRDDPVEATIPPPV
jgi:hypothetical protein